jgi:hypothetical protein
MSSLRGKSTRRKSTPVQEDVIEIPEELISQNRKIDLCIDIMYVNKCGFMTTIDQTIRFRSALPIENRTHEEYYHVLDMVLPLYNSTGFHINQDSSTPIISHVGYHIFSNNKQSFFHQLHVGGRTNIALAVDMYWWNNEIVLLGGDDNDNNAVNIWIVNNPSILI